MKNAQKTHNKNSNSLLPEGATAAVQKIISISRTLLRLSEQETKALVKNDMMGFALMQDEKEFFSSQYTKASEEFRRRIEEFRNVDGGLLKQLNNLQVDLSETLQSNNAFVERIRARAEKKHSAPATLIAVQEMGQTRFVNARNETQGA